MYLITAIRSDLTFSVSNCIRYMSNSNAKYYKALKRIWQYIRIIQNKDILYQSVEKSMLKDYVDSDWDDDYITKKLTTDYIFLFDLASISWSSRLQKSVTLNSCEAEYITLKETAKKLI